MQRGRLDKVLDKVYNFDGHVCSLRNLIEWANAIKKTESDGMCDWSRVKYNRMGSHTEQDAYEAGLRAHRYYYINGVRVPKIVYDAVKASG